MLRKPRHTWIWVTATASLALVAGLIVLRFSLVTADVTSVALVGGGFIDQLKPSGAAPGIRYLKDTRAHERVDSTRRRVEAALAAKPPHMLIGIDAKALREDGLTPAEVLETLNALARQVRGAGIKPIILEPRAQAGDGPDVEQQLDAVHAHFAASICGVFACVATQDDLPISAIHKALARLLSDG